MEPATIHLRAGACADAEEIARVHFVAVHATASAFYSPEILMSWSPPLDEARVAQFRGSIDGGEELFVVAEVEGVIRGFGSVVPAKQELRAVYVDPGVGQRGVGSAILRRIEELAAERGASRLEMDASINAERFYLKHGYAVVSRGMHRLLSGAEMACVRMSKSLRPGASSARLTEP